MMNPLAGMDFTPYSSVRPLISELPGWLPDEDGERLAAYKKYEEIYWQRPDAFQLMQVGSESPPIYVPNARTIVDATSHFYLKGLSVKTLDKPFDEWLQNFLKREKFYGRLVTNKHTGVARGDWLFHVTADEEEMPGARISLTTLDPATYFPDWDDDDLDKIIGVRLAEPRMVDGQEYVREKRYWYEGKGLARQVWVEENLYEADGWRTPRQRLFARLLLPKPLPEGIRTIPVYHFKNMDWQGRDFGTSELAGFERIMAAVNQGISDEELALELHGLGVYATDAGPPRNPVTNEVEDWRIAPARVMEVPSGAYFRKVEGIKDVNPFLDHIHYLDGKLFESSSTFVASALDPAVSQSGIALAIKFLPQMAKLEERDLSGVATLENLFYDLKFWWEAFEPEEFDSRWLELDTVIELGGKLPEDRTATLNELNNMLDRKVISRQYYRDKAARLGYEFPDDIEAQIEAEVTQDIERQRMTAEATGKFQQLSSGGNQENKSNNKFRPNESGGTEAQSQG